ncbi:unnamed protein product [Oikopleura dioica]|uniref:Uncharacterized protein n=1 Tax=Oikopleura dioica TaxID=34765 RepID=E4XKB0_OIKDI|nr:unnamed protein product [Oikopleura dioica]
MDWSFLANETCINVKYKDNEGCSIMTSDNQQFLSYQVDEYFDVLDWPLVWLHFICCNGQRNKFSQSIASHPSYGDVVNCKILSTETNLKSFSSSVFQFFFFFLSFSQNFEH